jgi:signal transduction histidine kinase
MGRRAPFRRSLEERFLPDGRSDSEGLSLLRAMDGGLVVADPEGHAWLVDEGARRLLGGEAGWPCVRDALAREPHATRLLRTGEAQLEVELPAESGGGTLSVRALRQPADAGGPLLVSLRDRGAVQGWRSNLVQAAQMRRLKSRTKQAAHDLRGPLNAIAINLELVRGDLAQVNGHAAQGREDALGRVDLVGREVARLSRMLTVLLGQSGSPRGEGRLFGLRRLLGEVAALVRAQAERQGVALRLDVPAERVAVQAPRDQVEQALMNLVNNALEAMPQGGRLELGLRADQETAVVHVRDTGPGISPAMLDQVFRMNYTTKADGTGLGLFTARATLEALGGRLDLQSTEGTGTTAVVTLPRAPLTETCS